MSIMDVETVRHVVHPACRALQEHMRTGDLRDIRPAQDVQGVTAVRL